MIPTAVHPIVQIGHMDCGVAVLAMYLGETYPKVAMVALGVDRLVQAFRAFGHLEAKLDPLGSPRPEVPELNPTFHGLTDALGARRAGGHAA